MIVAGVVYNGLLMDYFITISGFIRMQHYERFIISAGDQLFVVRSVGGTEWIIDSGTVQTEFQVYSVHAGTRWRWFFEINGHMCNRLFLRGSRFSGIKHQPRMASRRLTRIQSALMGARHKPERDRHKLNLLHVLMIEAIGWKVYGARFSDIMGDY